jgi:predicted helicase
MPDCPPRSGWRCDACPFGPYSDQRITKWDIFYFIYGVLHLPAYRQRFADDLKRDLPRIPFMADFRAFSEAGKQLAELHMNYEDVEPWPMQSIYVENAPLSYRVEKMKLSKDKTTLFVNDTLSLGDIPPLALEYRLGNRSALEWVIDQYQVSTDKRSGIVTDPNRADAPEYIVRLVERVVRVSVETMEIIAELPAI